MKRKTIIRASLASLSVAAMAIVGLVAFQHHENSTINAEASVGNYSTNITSYYNNISATSGTSLLGALHDLECNTHKTYTTYDDLGKNEYQKVLDADPNNSGKVIDFYSQVSWPGTWDPSSGSTTGGYNREHVWCQSLSNGLWGETGGGSDSHHVRPLEVRENSTRNNNPFGVVTNHNSSTTKYAKLGTNATYAVGGYLEDGVWEPIDASKGDVARILMYLYTHYNTYANVGGTTNGNTSGTSSYFGTLTITDVVSTSAGTAAAAWALLLEWSDLDPVSSYEITRNNVAANYQGNRNPFIDYPDLGDCIWGADTWDWTTRSISTGPRVSLNKTSATIAINGTVGLTATASGGTGSVSWTSSNTQVATVSASTGNSIIVTGKKSGTSTITASYAGQTATCAITVSATAPVVNSVSVNPPTLNLDLYGTKTGTITATVNGTNNPSQAVTWTSSNPSVATVDNGTVTAKSVGTANIVVTSVLDTDKSATCTVTVVNTSPTVLSETTYELITSISQIDFDRKIVIAAATYNYAMSVTQNSNNRGQAQIVKDTSANTISVNDDVAKFSISNGTTSNTYAFYDGVNEGYLYAAASDANWLRTQEDLDANASFTIEINSSSGVASLVAQGDATRNILKYNSSNSVFSCYESGQKDISLYQQKEVPNGDVSVSSVQLNKNSLSLSKGGTETLTATIHPTDATNKNVTWSSSVPSVATVDSDGKVTAVSVGTTIITVETEDGGYTASCTVTVKSSSTGTTYYEKQTSVSSIISGKYVICGHPNDSYYPMPKNTTGTNALGSSTAIPVSDNKISETNAADYIVDLVVSGTTVNIKNSSTTYIGASSEKKVISNATEAFNWTLSAGSNGTFRLGYTSSDNKARCLAYRLSYTRFADYAQSNVTASSTDYFDIELFKLTEGAGTYTVDNFVADFLSKITCDSTGANGPTFATGYSWAQLKTKYNSLTTAEKNELKSYTANQNGNDEAKCVARYDYIVGKYGTSTYENFMNRTIVNHSNKLGKTVVSNDAMLILITMSVLGTFTFAGWFIHKKKQYDL